LSMLTCVIDGYKKHYKHFKRQGTWQAYVDENLLGSGDVTSATITGIDGRSWARSVNFNGGMDELMQAANLFNNPSDAFANGINIGGTNYQATTANDRSIYGESGSNHVVMVKTNQVVIIATGDESKDAGNLANRAERLADYLIEIGY